MKPAIKCLAILLSAPLAFAIEARADAGDLDTSFNPGSGANGTVTATAVQADGKVVIVGSFNSYNGVARNRIARLNVNGSLDTTFNPGSGANAMVRCVRIQADGKVVIGGDFTTVDGYIANRIARLNVNGSYDTNFNPGNAFDNSVGADGAINALAVQGDGKIVIGGLFNTYRTVARDNIARLQPDGTLDTSFNPGSGTDFGVYAIAPAGGGKVYIGGQFNFVNGNARDGIARLNNDGSVDAGFNTDNDNAVVNALAVQPDGKLLVGGVGLNNPGPIFSVMRLNTNGSRDTSFEGFGTGEAKSIRVAPDGKIILGGSFNTLKLLRRKADGSHDPTFSVETQPNDAVNSVSLTPTGDVVIGGNFTLYGNTVRGRVARVLGVDRTALRNISTRAGVQTGERITIAGFIITGTTPKEVLMRGIGPSLGTQGVPNALQDPVIKLYNSSSALINSNNNWKDTQQNTIGETGIPPSDDREAALLTTLAPGSYTVALEGLNETTGNGLIELYDLTGGAAAKLANISTRSFVGAGDAVMIGGFIVEGEDARVVVRAIGPSLAAAGVTGALADPRVALYTVNGDLVGFNRDWQDGQGAEIAATGLQPSDDREAALIVTLQAGNYTAIAEGTDGTTGVGLVEVYHVE